MKSNIVEQNIIAMSEFDKLDLFPNRLSVYINFSAEINLEVKTFDQSSDLSSSLQIHST